MSTETRGSWGHSIRAATDDERMSWRGQAWAPGQCGRRCGEPVVFRASYYVNGPRGRPMLHKRFICTEHAERFARRYQLVLPSAVLPVDQALLPFGGLNADGRGHA
jgi:hypothetical protein